MKLGSFRHLTARRIGRLQLLLLVMSVAAAAVVSTAGPASASDPTFISGRYSWNQGAASVRMQSTATSVCVLTRVSGNFRGGGESVRVYASGGYWWLSGSSKQSGVNDAATCYRLAGFHAFSGTARWISPEFVTAWTNGGNCQNHAVNSWWGDAATFLSGMAGDFAGQGEYASVDQSANGYAPSIVHGNACQDDDAYAMRAYAFFAGAPSSGRVARYIYRTTDGTERNLPYDPTQSGRFVYAASGSTNSYTMAPTDSAMCYLTYVGGKFRGAGEYVDLSPQVISGVERWVLRVHSQQNDGVWGGALCYARSQ